MTDTKTETTKFATRDPLGEVQHRARELWVEAGKKAGESWKDYVSQAEADLCQGRAIDIPSTSNSSRPERRTNHSMIITPEISAEMQPFILEGSQTWRSLLANAMRKPLIDHESVCAAYVLENHEAELADGSVLNPLGLREIAEVLADLAGEYAPEFTEVFGADPSAIPRTARVEYWTSLLSTRKIKDEPLTYADQNTIRLIVSRITSQPTIKSLNYQTRPLF